MILHVSKNETLVLANVLNSALFITTFFDLANLAISTDFFSYHYLLINVFV